MQVEDENLGPLAANTTWGQRCLGQHYLGQPYLGQHYLRQHYSWPTLLAPSLHTRHIVQIEDEDLGPLTARQRVDLCEVLLQRLVQVRRRREEHERLESQYLNVRSDVRSNVRSNVLSNDRSNVDRMFDRMRRHRPARHAQRAGCGRAGTA